MLLIFAVPNTLHIKQKLLLFAVALLAYWLPASAQIDKGNMLLGGTMGYSTTTSSITSNTTSNANISPHIAFAIGNNSVIGVSGRYSRSKSKYNSNPTDYETTADEYGASIFYRKYLPIKEKVGWFVEGSGSYTATKYGSSTSTSYKTKGYTLQALPGIYYQLLPKMLIQANVGGISYNHVKNDSGSSYNYHTFKVDFFSQFTFGIDFIIGKKA